MISSSNRSKGAEQSPKSVFMRAMLANPANELKPQSDTRSGHNNNNITDDDNDNNENDNTK